MTGLPMSCCNCWDTLSQMFLLCLIGRSVGYFRYNGWPGSLLHDCGVRMQTSCSRCCFSVVHMLLSNVGQPHSVLWAGASAVCMPAVQASGSAIGPLQAVHGLVSNGLHCQSVLICWQEIACSMKLNGKILMCASPPWGPCAWCVHLVMP